MIERSANHLSSLALDRRADLREDTRWLKDQLDGDARVMVMQSGRVLVRDDESIGLFSWRELRSQSIQPHYTAFLGLGEQDQALFAISVDESAAEGLVGLAGGRFTGLRRIASRMDRHQAGLAAYARALDLWQQDHRYCGRCGSETQVDQGGFRRRCENPDCRREHFPRLDPAVIVIIGYQGRCLLGRQANWPEGRYSTLAGFVEPGESLEDAVRREVMEEAGVEVATVRYHSSQPWPFPSSLMIGFVAEAASDKMVCGDELEDVRWFSPEDLRTGIEQGRLGLPFTASVSYRLIAHWMREQHQIDIDEWNAGYRL